MKRWIVIFFAVASGSVVFGQELEKKDKYDDPRLNTPVPFTLGDRDRLHTVELKLEALEKNIDQRFDAMQKQMDVRFDAMQKQMDARFDFLQQLLLAIIGIMIAIGTGIFWQIQRINKILATHEGILNERKLREKESEFIEEAKKLRQEMETLRRGTTTGAQPSSSS